MKVYLTPETNSRGIMRVADALVNYLPANIELAVTPQEADLEVIHVYGRHDGVERRVNHLRRIGKPYAIIQYAIRSTKNPKTKDWIDMWIDAKAVWSYYDLVALCNEDRLLSPSFNFYYAPLGVDSEVFKEEPGPKKYIIAASSQHALSESVRECAYAAKAVDRPMFFLGHELRRGSDIVCKTGMDDRTLASYYSQCQYVSGLRRIEGFELPVIEGALCGARPIVFDQPHYRKWFHDFAIFIKEGTREEVIYALTEAFKNEPIFMAVSEKQKQVIRERFDWKTIIEGFWKEVL